MSTAEDEEYPLDVLCRALKNSRALRSRAEVYSGAAALALQKSTGSIVLFPTRGSYAPAAHNTALTDVVQTVAARIWGRDQRQAWNLHRRLFQALEEQAAAGSLYWQSVGGELEWDAEADTARQGAALTVLFSVRLSVDRVTESVGLVDAIDITEG